MQHAACQVGFGDGVQTIVGFENHSGLTELGPGLRPFGTVIAGAGNNGQDGTEGACRDNVYATYLHGPVLPKNPWLADHLIRIVLERKLGGRIELAELDDAARTNALTTLPWTWPCATGAGEQPWSPPGSAERDQRFDDRPPADGPSVRPSSRNPTPRRCAARVHRRIGPHRDRHGRDGRPARREPSPQALATPNPPASTIGALGRDLRRAPLRR